VNLLVWILVSSVVGLGPIAFLPRSARRWSELGVLYAVVWALTFGVASLVWVGSPSVSSGIVVVSSSQIVEAVALTTLGIGSFWAGYLLLRRHAQVDRPTTIAVWRVRWAVVVIVYLLGFGARLILMQIGLAGYSLTPSLRGGTVAEAPWAVLLLLVGMTVEVAAYAAVAWSLYEKRYRAVAVLMVAGLVLTGIVGGSKGGAIAPLFAASLIYISYRRRVPRSLLAGAVAILVIILPGSQLFRFQPQAAALTLDRGAYLASLRDALDLDLSEQAAVVGDWLTSRPQSVDQIALIMAQTPHPNDYQLGFLWALAPVYNVVPRAIWPSKPLLALEYDFDHTYRRIPPDVPGNTGVTLPGDMYINFGLPGVVVGMLLWGMALAWVSVRWRQIDRPDRLMLFVIAASYILLPDRSFTSMLLVLPRILLAAWLVSRLIFVRER
jgi:hypothetical protein